MRSATTPNKIMTFHRGAELEQCTRAARAITGLRVFFRELSPHCFISGPTPLFTDAQVVLDGTPCRRVSNESKLVATNYAVARQSEEDGGVVYKKLPAL
jgi:hypothetical protein